MIYEHANEEDFHIYKRVFLSQHSDKPYLVDDDSIKQRWKIKNNKVIILQNNHRASIKTFISKARLDCIRRIAKEKNTHINYLLEPVLQKIIEENNYIERTKKVSDRVEFRTTFDEETVRRLKTYAKNNKYKLNEILEYVMNEVIHLNR